MQVFPVILAGGSGSRLWPMSGGSMPKQFLKLFGDRSLFQNTVLRLADFAPLDRVRTVCGESQAAQIEADLNEIEVPTQDHVVAEPVGRNTAPAIMLAVKKLVQSGDDPILVILPADHHIEDPAGFCATLQRAVEAAQEGHIVTLGIRPHAPETGYGYIEVGEGEGAGGSFPVARFVEKPDLETAKTYLDSGCFLWNSGMFVFKASVMLAECEAFEPEILTAMDAFLAGDAEAYGRAPRISIDYAIMERTQKARVVPADFGWSDLGTWSSVLQRSETDENGNMIRGQVMTKDCKNSYLRAEDRTLAVLGADDLVVVETRDAVLVARSGYSQDVSAIYKEAQNLPDLGEKHDWGVAKQLSKGDGWCVNQLTINPGSTYCRQGHLVIASGAQAGTSIQDETLSNNSNTPMVAIETRWG